MSRDQGSVHGRSQHAVAGDPADLHGVQLPLGEDLPDLVFAAARGHQQHALLRLGQHDLVGRHPRLTLGHAGELHFHARARSRRHLRAGAGEPGRPHVLYAQDRPRLHGLEAGFEEELLREGIAHLHGRPALFGALVERGRSHGRPVDTVPSGLRSHVEDGIARPLRARTEDPVLADEADGHGVDEGIARVLRSELHLAAQVGHAEAVAVPADAGHHAVDETATPLIPGIAEAKGVENGDGARSHGEDVAEDAAYTGGGALEGLDERWMIVALDLEGQREVAAQIHDARVFARTLENGRSRGGQPAQEDARVLVGAVLRPQGGEKTELGIGGFPAEPPDDAVVLLAGEA